MAPTGRKRNSGRCLLSPFILILTHGLIAVVSFNCGRIFDNVCTPCESQQQQQQQQPFVYSTAKSTHGHPSQDDKNESSTLVAVVPDTLPGAFANNSLYLQAIRLTKSFNRSIDDLHVDLFTFPGDLTKLTGPQSFLRCRNIPEQFNGTLWGRDEILANVKFYCQLDSLTIILQRNSSYKQHFNHNPIRMFIVPMESYDTNQNFASPIISRCNVTDILSRSQLVHNIHDSDVAHNEGIGTLSVHIWMQLRDEPASKLATFEIPLDTGASGAGSASVRGAVAKSYFLQPTVPVGLCLAIYAMRPVRYLAQFVQHHLNVGFHSIVIGIKGPPESNELKQAQRMLQRYIDQGLVSLADYDGPFDPQEDASKLQFYFPCLYHYKGLAKHVATWDIDEFWVPPAILQTDGRHNREHLHVENDGVFRTNQSFDESPKQFINASTWSKFPQIIRDDPLWQISPYSHSVSIEDTVNAIERYYEEHGCASSYCFHAFPSLSVLLRNGRQHGNRTTRLSDVFHLRARESAKTWLKSIVNTQVAHSLGYHMGGSCLFQHSKEVTSEQLFYEESDVSSCYARLFEHDVYGAIHHLFELFSYREPDRGDNATVPDEYITIFAPTVERQLDRDDPHSFVDAPIF